MAFVVLGADDAVVPFFLGGEDHGGFEMFGLAVLDWSFFLASCRRMRVEFFVGLCDG